MLPNSKDIAKEYREAKNPRAQIRIMSQLYGAPEEAIRDALAREGIFVPVPVGRKFRQQERQRLYNQGLSDAEIARRTGCKVSTIRNWRWSRSLPDNEDKRKKCGGE